MSQATFALIVIAAVAIALVTIVLVRTLNRLSRMSEEMERLSQEVRGDLFPRLERVLERVEAELDEVRTLTESARGVTSGLSRVAISAGEIVAQTQQAVTPVIETVVDLGGVLRQVSAAFAGFRAGLAALRRSRYDWEEDETGNLFH